VNIERAIEEARAGAAGAIFLNGGPGGFLNFWVIGQPEIAIRAEHEDLPAVYSDFGVLRGGNAAEVGVQTRGAELGGAGEISDLVEQRKGQLRALCVQRSDVVIQARRGHRTCQSARQNFVIPLVFKRRHLLLAKHIAKLSAQIQVKLFVVGGLFLTLDGGVHKVHCFPLVGRLSGPAETYEQMS
jgi:hypothetical protein